MERKEGRKILLDAGPGVKKNKNPGTIGSGNISNNHPEN
jgi:hypothetical protein